MKKFIARNSMIVLGPDPDDGPRFRVLHSDPGKDVTWLYACDPGRHMPFAISRRQLERRFKEKSAHRSDFDPYRAYPRLDSDLTTAELEVRNRNWDLIAPLVEDGGLALLLKAHRHQLILARAAECGTVGRHTLFAILRRYWRGGQTPDALVPAYRNCGGPGKSKTRGEAWIGIPPDGFTREELQPLDPNKLDKAVKAFIEAKKDNVTASRAYEHATNENYGVSAVVRGHEGKVLPKDRRGIPSYNTLKYHVRKQLSADQDLAARLSKREFNNKHRPIVGRSSSKIFGPGQVWQVDATPWEPKVRSRLHRSVTIGTATVYLVVDAFSQVIVGFYVTLHAERAEGALMALAHALSDKDEYLRSIGLEPRAGGFPVAHGCARILSDQGAAFTARLIDLGAGRLRIDNSNTPPYRPDLKAEVESAFMRIQEGQRLRHADAEAFGQGRPTHDDDGVYTLPELEQQIALTIMMVNSTTVIRSLPDNWVSIDGTDPTPMQLHEFGLANMAAPPFFTEEQVALALLPRGSLRWNGKNLTLQEHGLHYGVEPRSTISMVRNNDSPERIYPCVYNPRDMSEVRILAGGRLGERCQLVGMSSSTPRYSLMEQLLFKQQKKANTPVQKAQLQHDRSRYKLEQGSIRKDALAAAGGVVAKPVPGVSQAMRKVEQDLPVTSDAPRFVQSEQIPTDAVPVSRPLPANTAVFPSGPSPAAALKAAQLKQRELARSMLMKETGK